MTRYQWLRYEPVSRIRAALKVLRGQPCIVGRSVEVWDARLGHAIVRGVHFHSRAVVVTSDVMGGWFEGGMAA